MQCVLATAIRQHQWWQQQQQQKMKINIVADLICLQKLLFVYSLRTEYVYDRIAMCTWQGFQKMPATCLLIHIYISMYKAVVYVLIFFLEVKPYWKSSLPLPLPSPSWCGVVMVVVFTIIGVEEENDDDDDDNVDRSHSFLRCVYVRAFAIHEMYSLL